MNTQDIANPSQSSPTAGIPAIKTSLVAASDVQELAQARLGKVLAAEELAAYVAFARDLEQRVLARAARIKEQGGPSQSELALMLQNPAIAYVGRLVAQGASHG